MDVYRVLRVCLYACVVVSCCAGTMSAQVVRVAPIVKQTPTADVDTRLPGATPPQSEAYVEPGGVFYVELWATNTAAPLDGLACVYVDLNYGGTELIDAVPPAQDSPLFPVNAASAVFDDPAGTVADLGGCQAAPPILLLGVGEWVMVKRIEMDAVAVGGPLAVSLDDAENAFVGVSIIGESFPVDPADIDFQERTFYVAWEIPAVPAISEWGLVVATLLILTAGTVVFAGRRTANAL